MLFLEILCATDPLLLHIFHIVKFSFLLPFFRTIHWSINNNLFTSSKKADEEKTKNDGSMKNPEKNYLCVKIDAGLSVGRV